MRLPSVSFIPIDLSLIPPEISKLPRAQKRIMELLKKGSATTSSSASKSWSLDFQLSPRSFNAADISSKRVSSMSFEKTFLSPDAFDPYAKANGTGEHIDLQAQLAFRSIGYKSEPLQSLSDLGVPFDGRLGFIPNDQYGRVLASNQGPAGSMTERNVPGMYCAGWVKRGPTGVIASTMNDAFATADVIAEDWYSHASFIGSANSDEPLKDGWAGLKGEAEKRGCRRVSWQDWELIDKAERERGAAKGKEREKFTKIEDMLAVIDQI
jgi:adrenodoxin-NADP+ reductase